MFYCYLMIVFQARQHVQGVRHTFLLLLMLQLSLVVMQLLDSMLLPPVLAPHHVLWLAALGLPLLALTINANPLDPDIMKKALGKNIHHLSNQVHIPTSSTADSLRVSPSKSRPLPLTHSVTCGYFCIHPDS